MPDLDRQIAAWRDGMAAAGVHRREDLDELEAHLRELYQRKLNSGNPDAFAAAVSELGQCQSVSREFAIANQQRRWGFSHATVIYVFSGWLLYCAVQPATWFLFHARWEDFPLGIFGFTLRTRVILPMFADALIGYSLLRRTRFARKAAIIWSAIKIAAILVLAIAQFWQTFISDVGHYGSGSEFTLFGNKVFIPFYPVRLTISAMLYLSAIVLLTRPTVINLFTRKKTYV